LFAVGTEIALAAVRSFAVFMRAEMSAEPTFHRSCLTINVSPFYLAHHILMHYLEFLRGVIEILLNFAIVQN